MKKVLSFVLVLAMILGSVSMAFAAPYSTGSTAVSKKNTVEPFVDAQDNAITTILRDLGAIKGSLNDKGEYVVNPKGELTRAEAATLVVIAMGLGDQGATKTATKFTDVTADHWASGYIAVAAAQGYVGGTTPTTFNPDAKMTMDEVIALLLKVLGYSDTHLQGSWPANFRDLALRQSILTDVKYGTQNATRQDIFQVLYNCLDKDLVIWNEDSTAANKYQVAVNGLSLIKKMTGVDTYKNVYDIPTTEIILTADNVDFKNGFDASEFYGKLVRIVYKNGQAIGVSKVSSKGLVGKFADATTTTFTAIDGTVYTGITIATNTNLYVNGGLTTAAIAPLINKNDTYTLDIKTDANNATKVTNLYSVSLEKVTAIAQVSASQAAFLAEDKIASVNALAAKFAGLEFATTTGGVVDPDEALAVEGAVTALKDIKEDDIVEVYKNWATEQIAKVVVTRNVVTGIPTEYDSIAKKYTLAGKQYKEGTLTVAGTSFNAINLVSTWALYLDAKGNVAFACEPKETKAPETPWIYAFVLDVDAKSNTEKNPLFVDDETATTYGIKLVNAGEKETKIFTNTTTKGLDMTVTAGNFIQYKASEGKITTMKAVAAADKKAVDGTKKITVNGVPVVAGTVSKLYADGVVVINLNNEKAATDVAMYAVDTVANVADKKYADAFVVLNEKSDKVTVLVISGSATTAAGKITAAAIVAAGKDQTGTYASLLVKGEVKKYYTENDYSAATATDLYDITLDGEKISDCAVTVTLMASKASTAALEVKADVVFDGTTEVAHTLNPVVYVYNTTSKVFEVKTDLQAAMDAAKDFIKFYDANNDGFCDIVTVK